MITAARQSVAMFVDAYRELAAGKLFWITLMLSGVVVAAFAALGIDEQGVTMLWFRLGFPPITSDILPPDLLYKQLFVNFAIPWWLGLVATVLALVSTAGIIPSFVSGGTIDLALSKPIGRVRLFLTRFLTALAFAGLQVGTFTLACFLVIGIRGGDWVPRIFLAVPIVLAFFSYLYAVSALIGLVTRSAIAALLLTMLLWIGLMVINRTDEVLLVFRVQSDMIVERNEQRVANGEQLAATELARREREGIAMPPKEEWPENTADEMELANPFLAGLRAGQAKDAKTNESLRAWHGRVVFVKTVLPKTADTLALMDRVLLSKADYDRIRSNEGDEMPTPLDQENPINEREFQKRIREEARARSLFWVLGTSLGFEAVLLAIGCTIFARRDF